MSESINLEQKVNSGDNTATTTLGVSSSSTGILKFNSLNNSVNKSVSLTTNPSTSQNYIMKLPSSLGTQGKVLSIDTVDGNTGILTWTSPGGGILADDIGIGTSDISITNTSGKVLIDSQSSTTTIDGHTGVVIQANTGHLEIKEGLNNTKYLKLHADTDNCIISGEVKQQGVANQNARNLVFEAGQGTGIGTGGDIIFKVAKSGASGSDNNPFITALTIKQDAVIEFNNNLSVNDGI